MMIPLAISAKNQLSSTEGKDFNMESARPAPNNRNNYITAEAVQT